MFQTSPQIDKKNLNLWGCLQNFSFPQFFEVFFWNLFSLDQGRTNPAFSKPCLFLSDTRHFRHFRRFRGSEERSPCFQRVKCKFVIFAVFVKTALFWQGTKTRFTKNTVCATPTRILKWSRFSRNFPETSLEKFSKFLDPVPVEKLSPSSKTSCSIKQLESARNPLLQTPFLPTYTPSLGQSPLDGPAIRNANRGESIRRKKNV